MWAKTKSNIKSLNQMKCNEVLNNEKTGNCVNKHNISTDSAYHSCNESNDSQQKECDSSKRRYNGPKTSIMTLNGEVFGLKSSHRLSWMSRDISNYTTAHNSSHYSNHMSLNRTINKQKNNQQLFKQTNNGSIKQNSLINGNINQNKNQNDHNIKANKTNQIMVCPSTQTNVEQNTIENMIQLSDQIIMSRSNRKIVQNINKNVHLRDRTTNKVLFYPSIQITIQNSGVSDGQSSAPMETEKLCIQTSEQIGKHIIQMTPKFKVKTKMIAKSPKIGFKCKIKPNLSENSLKDENEGSDTTKCVISTKVSIRKVIVSESSDQKN